jgi:4-diphosphocytidyl-2-C-methyl-D-erythritol kinase
MGQTPDLACLALDKRVPAAAGLGGGSSDAAAAWRLGRAWRGLPDGADEEDLAMLSMIGADVPFFAAATPAARVTGIGERVAPMPAVEREVVLVHPPFGLSTAEIFAELREDEWGGPENDLLPPARRLRPELDDLFDAVAAAGGQPKLTGSGPTIFSLEENFERAAALATHLGGLGLRVTHTRTRATAPTIQRIEEEL